MTSASQLFPVLQSLGFDVQVGTMLCGDDEEFYCGLIRELHSDVLPRRHAELLDPVSRKDFAHLLKGTLSTLGESAASTLARRLDQAIREGDPQAELTADLLTILDRIDQRLSQVFGVL